jgi:hypothetical protein
VRGLAFSFTLAELNLSTAEPVVSLLGVNLGVELVQLLVVALVVPPLILLAHHDRGYRLLRAGAAALAGAAAVASTRRPAEPLRRPLDTTASTTPWRGSTCARPARG